MIKILKKVCNLAKDSGHFIMDFYLHKERIKVYYKPDNTPVTNVDYKVNNIIKNSLFSINPHIPIISEEESYNTKLHYKCSRYWLVDPLDGTKEFLNNNGDFTVNISLIENGIPILGVIYAPFFKVLYYSLYNTAWKEEDNINREIQVSNSIIPLVVVSRSHFDEKINSFLKNLKDYTINKMGSSLKFCYIAEGKAQIYPRFGNTNTWDTAAGEAILIAAGGIVKTWKGDNLNYQLSSSFLNSGFCASVL
ncbi:3'(2'),5'-bisphosphate nucleotidase CysQ [Buchnera aphidicola]|uniref:3'(2'),5'-bisphosphate nucleotidase CysQ n=1 Tax=Buchnera aphidicola TaxID=9 RepID=UPI003BEED07F